MKATAFDYARPATLDAALVLLGDPDAKPIAGGQSLGPMLAFRVVVPTMLVDISRLDVLRAVREDADAVTFGAAVTHAAIEDGRVPDPTCGMMPTIANGIAYRAVRNRGTIGGSLSHADPSADWVSTMPALGAEMLIAGPDGERTVAAAAFVNGTLSTLLREGELLVGVRVPRLSPAARWTYRKTTRKTGEFAHAIAAIVLDPDRGVRRLVIGATGAEPHTIQGDDVRLDDLVSGDPGAPARIITSLGITDDPIDARIHAATLARAVRDISA